MFNKLNLKNEIFDLFENARVLFNDFYNGKDNYNDTDIKAIINILKRIENVNIKNIKEEVENLESESE